MLDVPKPVWTSASFLLYLGGLTVLGAAVAALAYVSGEYGSGGSFVAWTLLPLSVLLAVALAFRRRGEWTAAGLFAVAAVAMWIAFAGSLLDWWGWLPEDEGNPFAGGHWGAWLLTVLVLAGAVAALRTFRFPLLVVYTLSTSYYLVVDVLSGGGSWSAVLTLFVGFAYLALGVALDNGPRRPYGFWLHVAAGLAIGGALLYWWHSSDADYALLTCAGLAYVGVAGLTGRSTWAVLGAGAILAAGAHWIREWTSAAIPFVMPGRNWVPPLGFAVVGFAFVLLGLALQRRRPA